MTVQGTYPVPYLFFIHCEAGTEEEDEERESAEFAKRGGAGSASRLSDQSWRDEVLQGKAGQEGPDCGRQVNGSGHDGADLAANKKHSQGELYTEGVWIFENLKPANVPFGDLVAN